MIQLSARVIRVPPSRYASFALALPVYQVFTYALDAAQPQAGTRYRLPFAGRERTGLLLEPDAAGDIDPARIKPADDCLDEAPVLDAHMMALASWLADYYLQPLGEVLFQCLPGYLRRARPQRSLAVRRYRLAEGNAEALAALARRAPKQWEICQALAASDVGLTAAELKLVNPNWHAAVRALEARGLVVGESIAPSPAITAVAETPAPSVEQAAILQAIETRREGFGVHLLDGITGSGKTEIYLRLIGDALAAGRQVIYLVPEIGLTRQLIERVGERFGEAYALSHSALTELQRYRAWERFRRGEVGVMLGTRSSLFAQSERLGLIIVDEEHDASYRQDDGIRYHARDVAIKRAQMLDIPVILGSATPALETLHNSERDTWYRYRLDERPTAFPPPPIQLVDLRQARLEFGLCSQAFGRIDHHLGCGGQVLIYLNRRGYAPVMMCHECGWQALCQQCDARLTLHQSVQALLCHHCGHSRAVPDACPDCGHGEIRHHGVGTEQLERGLAQRYADFPVLRIDRDVIASREMLESRLERLQSGAPCLLVGTQMIAKGHDYPAITLAVILDADQALFSASYRAGERLAQTIFQVAGRSGRGDRAGEALVQTRFPEHPLMRALAFEDYRAIAARLLDERREYGLPPFSRVVLFRADAVELDVALERLGRVADLLRGAGGIDAVSLIGPMPALMTRRIGRYRAQLCLMSADFRALRAVLRESLPAICELPSSSRVNLTIDVDALDF